jgi:hypothetical protein
MVQGSSTHNHPAGNAGIALQLTIRRHRPDVPEPERLATAHCVGYIAPLLMLFLFCGCTKTVTKPGLDAKATEHASFTFPDQTYYVGSGGGYDYFVIRSGMGGSTHRYRVPESEGAITSRFNVTKDETRWRGYGITGIVVTNGQIAFPKR